ncbi:Nucleoside-diphosphate-sugar epimerase [Amycolatopsis marina]|uniref:Nucleoside-diphosphate-sugar epimerase n=1 Tax=Amycolatopsis marina TaxID=490629 RepID=A0A1I1C6H1_9PSEU|nr:Nucleoside-diphosphate-sugar epimerase [Amycolatopsis marina]
MCAARGESGTIPEGARLLPLDRDQPDAVRTALAGERFDAVLDVATMALPWVRDALDVLADNVGHWTFVSSINAYADTVTQGQKTDAPVLEPITDEQAPAERTAEHNGGVKVACENAVRDAVGADRTFVVRPGDICGPGDYMDRFGYWPVRLSRGGRVAIPDDRVQPYQHIDVRDLAAWIVTAGEQGTTGTYDTVTHPTTLHSTLHRIAELVAPAGTELVPVSLERLSAEGVDYWAGPGALPLWLPASHYGMVSHDPTTAYREGLETRPFEDTVQDVLADERARGIDRERAGGLSPEQERALLG